MDLARISLSGARYRLGSSSCPVVYHSDDPTGLFSIRLDREGIQREQARSVWTDQVDAEHQATDLAIGLLGDCDPPA
jgi:hypothetical protein